MEMATILSQEVMTCLADLVDKPLAFVYWAYPWGEGELSDATGPDLWQEEQLRLLEASLRESDAPIQQAVASGHGVGKGALSSWLVQWAMATRPHLQGVVTANTQQQLVTKTWRELAKWHGLLRPELRRLFTWSATRYAHLAAPETWYVAAIPWSERNAEAFQGAHDRYVLMIFDEASAIPAPIWEAADGSMTTPRAMRFAFGNPTRTSGRFRDCFPGGRFAHRWVTRQVDGRTCAHTNKAELARWVTDYGDDSDYVRVRVRGLFPRASSRQLIGEDLITEAQQRAMSPWQHAPRVLGVDVARYGQSKTVLILRQGPRIIVKRVFRHQDLMTTASDIAMMMTEYAPDSTLIDAVGIGAGVVDRLRQLGYGGKIVAVNVAEPAIDAQRYRNLRAEMWAKMRDWVREAGVLPADDMALAADLVGPEYSYDIHERLQLESKDDMLRRNVASPDEGDALALTFARPVSRRVEPNTPPQFATGGLGRFTPGTPPLVVGGSGGRF